MDIGVTSSTLLVCVYLLSINEEHTSPVQVLKRIDHVLNEHLRTISSEGEGEDGAGIKVMLVCGSDLLATLPKPSKPCFARRVSLDRDNLTVGKGIACLERPLLTTFLCCCLFLRCMESESCRRVVEPRDSLHITGDGGCRPMYTGA